MNRFIPAALALFAAACLTGCPPPDEGLGGLGVLSFDWRLPDGGQRSIEVPLAEGTRGILQVEGGAEAPIIREADSTDRSVLRVISVEGDRIHLEALAEGTATVEVFTHAGNDWIELQVQAVDRISLAPKFSATRVLRDGVDVLHVRRFGRFGGELVGHAPVELTFEPADAAERLPAPTHELRLAYADVGEVRVNTDGDTLRRLVVEREVLRVLEVFDVPDVLFAEATHDIPLAVYDRDGIRLGGLEGLLTVQSFEEGTCSARLSAAWGEPVIEIEARRAGRCMVDVTLDGLSERIELDVTP